MWSPSWETPGRRGPEPPEVAKETQLQRRSSPKTQAPQSGRAVPENLSSSWKWRARPAGESYAFLGSCCSIQGSIQGQNPEETLTHWAHWPPLVGMTGREPVGSWPTLSVSGVGLPMLQFGTAESGLLAQAWCTEPCRLKPWVW